MAVDGAVVMGCRVGQVLMTNLRLWTARTFAAEPPDTDGPAFVTNV